MKLLLDTHAFIWWDSHREKLPDRVIAACEDPANTLHVSIASVWEMQIKAQLGKLDLRQPLAGLLADQQSAGVEIVSIAVEDVSGLAKLPPIHRDPFDRMLVAQAQRGRFRLVSRDPLVAQYGVPVFW